MRRSAVEPSRRCSRTSPTTSCWLRRAGRVAGRRAAGDEDGLFALAEHLPQEAAEALLDLAVGAAPKAAEVAAGCTRTPFAHPDAQRRFRVMANVEELQPGAGISRGRSWTVFLHPAQRELVERRTAGRRGWRARPGPARPSWRCTGRRIWRGAIRDARVLLTTFSQALAHALKIKLKRLLDRDPSGAGRGSRWRTSTASATGSTSCSFGPSRTSRRPRRSRRAGERRPRSWASQRFSRRSCWREWQTWWMPGSSGAGRPIATSRASAGRRGSAASSARRCGPIFERVRAELATSASVMTWAEILGRVDRALSRQSGKARSTSSSSTRRRTVASPQLRFLPRWCRASPDALFFAGDLGPADLPAAVLVEVARRRRARALAHAARSTTAPRTRSARRPTVLLPRQIARRRRQRGSRARHRSRCSTGPTPDRPLVRRRAGGDRAASATGSASGARRQGVAPAGDRRLRPLRAAARPGAARGRRPPGCQGADADRQAAGRRRPVASAPCTWPRGWSSGPSR